MKSKHVLIGVFVVLGAAALVSAGILIGKTRPSAAEREGISQFATSSSAQMSGSAANSSSNSSAPQETCVQKEKRITKEKNIEYQPGTLLVSFKTTVTFSQAKLLIDSKGLKLHNSPSLEDFENSRWLTVNVPQGEEFDWMCTLRASSEVKSATLNLLFDLAQ